jgi:hypothetical protein
MKRVLVAALISLVAMAVAAPAPAAGPTVKSLARQIKALQKDVKTLKAQVTTARQIAASALVYSACSTAVTADAIQGTWTILDAKLSPTYGPIFGPQTPTNDYQTCQPLQISRAPTQSPPNAGVFNSLLALFK